MEEQIQPDSVLAGKSALGTKSKGKPTYQKQTRTTGEVNTVITASRPKATDIDMYPPTNSKKK